MNETLKLTSPSSARSLAARLGINPSRARGQNFLVDANILRIILDTADIKADDCVLEIGAGLGTLTQELASRAAHVTAVEIEDRLCTHLVEMFAGNDKVQIVCRDALDIDLEDQVRCGVCKVVANLPYSVGSRLLMSLVSLDEGPERVVVTVQLEVAERLSAVPGTKEFGLLSVWAQSTYDVSKAWTISPTCFWPRPKVRSAVVKMVRREKDLRPANKELFRKLTKLCFTYRRKQMQTILGRSAVEIGVAGDAAKDAMQAAGIPPESRPEDLFPSDWSKLVDALALSSH